MNKRFWLLGLVLFAAFVAYNPALTGSFLVWDDNRNIYHNPHYQPVTLESLARFWYQPYEKTFRPIIYSVWGLMSLVARQAGPSAIPGDGVTPFHPAVFHAANLVLHAVNVALVWFIASRYVRRAIPLATTAALFALHPLQVESVAWVTGFNELLCGTLCLACTAFFLDAMLARAPVGAALPASDAENQARIWATDQSGGAGEIDDAAVQRTAYAKASLFYALALLVKPATVALPLVLLVMVWALDQTKIRRALKSLLPWLGAGLLFSAITSLSHPDTYSGAAPPLWARFFIAGDALAFYWAKLIWPVQLCLDYGRKPDWVLQQWWIWISWLVPAFLALGAWAYRKKSPWPTVAFFGMMAWLLPVCGLKPFHFQLQFSTVADRYMYFGLFPVALALGMTLDRVQLARRWQALALAAVALAWTTLSFAQSRTWRTNFTAFNHVLTINPGSWMANANIGAAYDNQGDQKSAERHFQAALDINPTLWQMHIMLGRYALSKGETVRAVHHFRQALAIKPGQPEAEANLRRLGDAPRMPMGG